MTAPTSSEDMYRVVINAEEQCSIWPSDRDLPPGWRAEGTAGTKAECLAHIDAGWKDMRPASLRKRMEHRSDASDRTNTR